MGWKWCPGTAWAWSQGRDLISEVGFVEIAVLIGEKSLPVDSDGESEQHYGRGKRSRARESCIESSLQQWCVLNVDQDPLALGIEYVVPVVSFGGS